MNSQNTYTMKTFGAIELDLSVSSGTIRVVIDPHADHAEVRVHSTAGEGAIADAVNRTAFTECGNKLTVSIPDKSIARNGGASVVQVDGSSTIFNNGNAVSISSPTGTIISDGDVWINGQKVVSNGQVIVERGARIGTGADKITVDVVLPAESSLAVSTKNAETTVHGALRKIRFEARDGSLQADSAKILDAKTHNGSILVGAVDEKLEAFTHNGPISISTYSGHRGSARTHNGNVTINSTPAASGKLTVRTHNGNIRVRGAGHLDLKTSTHNGSIR